MNRFKVLLCAAVLLGSIFSLCACSTSSDNSSQTKIMQNDEQDETLDAKPTAAPTEIPHVIDIDMTALAEDSKKTLGDYSEEFASFAKSLNNGEDTFTFSSEASLQAAIGTMSDLPVYDFIQSYTVDGLNADITFSTENIPAKLDSLDLYVQSFAAENISDSMNDFEKCLMVYKYCSGFSYDEKTENMLTVFKTKTASDYGLARVFSFLLRCYGIDSRILCCTLSDGSSHYLPCALISDKFYAFDPELENSANGGTGLDYFMMSSSKAKTCGLSAAFSSGRDGYFQANFSVTVDTGKDTVFNAAADWSLDKDAHYLYISKNSDNTGEYSVSFNTATLTEVQ